MKVIARTSHISTVFVAMMLSPIIFRPVMNPTIPGLIWAILSVAVIVRVSQIHLAVGRGVVRVQNFFRTTEVPIWEAEVEEGEPEPELGFNELRDGEEETAGRMLYIRRPWHGDRVHVTAAPRFGEEAVRVRSELESEIGLARAA